MGGGLMQLVAYGAQDIYLTGNPQITFFKVVYRRHTNFSMECIKQTINGNFNFGKEGSTTISRNGDLIGQMYLSYNLKDNKGIQSNFGNAMIKNAEIEIGGQLVDRQDGRWMQIQTDLTEPNPSGNPCGSCPHQKLAGIGVNFGNTENSTTTKVNTVYWVPFKFWFCRNPGLYLPLIALQYHEVKLKIELWEDTYLGDASVKPAFAEKYINLWVDYVYLDTDERRRFAQVSHEYLIEQVQMKKSNWDYNTNSVKLNFNHPVKELVWVYSISGGGGVKNNFFPGVALRHSDDLDGSITQGTYDDTDGDYGGKHLPINFAKNLKGGEADPEQPASFIRNREYGLKLNGHDRFYKRDSHYFTLTQVWKHHTGYGSPFPVSSIYVYSFALKPEEHQPSGTCNFSRIDSATLDMSLADKVGANETGVNEINIYAINYNVLRIMSGMGGLAYSN